MNTSRFDKQYPLILRERNELRHDRGERFDFCPCMELDIKERPQAPVSVRILGCEGADDREQNALGRKHKEGDYMTGTPSIILSIGSERIALTWAEAYNLGFALISKADEAFYG